MKNIFFFLVILSNYVVSAQYKITGTVIDNNSNNPIKNVQILDVNSNKKVNTDASGKFEILATGDLKIFKDGYDQKIITITKDQDITIILISTITDLDEVIINSLSIPATYKYSTEAISIVSTEDIQRGNPIELHPILNRVPGVFMQNATLNTNRITIRGIGARNLFGTANIRAYYGDIPLTDGNGESSIEDLELGALSGIEIHKGPSSSSYGVGLGGTILLKPDFSTSTESKAMLSSTFGSYGLRRILAKATVGSKKSKLNILYSNNHSDGYRDNNEYDRNTITLTSTHNLGDQDNITFLGSYINLKAGIPSSLDQEDYDNTPRQAAFTWGRSQAFEDVDYAILGLTWKHQYNSSLSHNTSIFGSFRDNHEPRPFNILKENSSNYGIRSRVLGSHNLKLGKIDWNLGGEFFYDNYSGRTFENLYEDFPIGTGSVQGNQLSDLEEKRYYYNLFAETNYELSKKLRFNLGLHLNQTFFNIDDQFLLDGEDSSGEFDFTPILSPKIGVNYQVNANFTLFGNIAHGFSTPTTSETLLPDGIFNPDIKPEKGWNYEIGTRYKLFNNKLYGSLSIYTLRVDDLLVSRRTADDNFFAINAGKTSHNGIETTLNYDILQLDNLLLTFFANASINDYTFNEFIDLDNDFSDNDLTGVPSEVINLGIDLITEKGFYGNLNFQSVGSIPVNDANTVFSDSYTLLHGKLGYKNTLGNRLEYNLFFGANNILDTKYVSQLQINARGFGGNAPRYFYPGLPFNIYSGININYRF
ncbi:TonB-dependent receptor domain-containing protein [Aquimarina sp. 2201CG5-10]|uniref:TonB-dependent receptor domain-containing protein n=1 Tax=Aquimarina callyspongiae TaxID=3098150 RepID=UPI002AB380C0|nr:TonB-dependent receptor [Aquimarina sp. 2201CG5-10]MDY8137627.1 TonB-dependent receptor [Aquimarina sp. 2201CG5-10]